MSTRPATSSPIAGAPPFMWIATGAMPDSSLSSSAPIALTDLVENYPGFPEGISGFDLSQKMKEQAEQFGAEVT